MLVVVLLVWATPTSVPRPQALPWILASDWDDTIKAGGHGVLFGIRGIGKRIEGTYPSMTALLAELDPCWSGRESLSSAPSFQIWSAKPFGSKKQSSCSPPLHRLPVTRHGSLRAGIRWALANKVPRRFERLRAEWLEQSAKAMGRAKFRTFRQEARRLAAAGADTEILFFGDSAQGDAHAASLILDSAEYGSRAFVFIHDLTRGTMPHEPPCHVDERIAIKEPLKHCRAGWRSARICYFKTVPEAAFQLAQHGFLEREALQFVVEASRREMGMLHVERDEVVLHRLRSLGRAALPYDELVRSDLEKCEAMLRHDACWACDEPVQGAAADGERRALATAEVEAAAIGERVRRSPSAHERAQRAASFKEASLQAKLAQRLQ